GAIDAQKIAGLQVFDALEGAVGHAAETRGDEIFEHGLAVGVRRRVESREEGFRLRGEQQFPAVVAVDEGLDAEAIAGCEATLSLLVPEEKGEHAVQTRQALLAPGGPRSKDYLGVAGSAERPGRLQLLAQLGVVVDFTVVDEGIAPVRAAHGLG